MEFFVYLLIVGTVAKKLHDYRQSLDDREREQVTDPDSLKFVSVYEKVREMNQAVDELEKNGGEYFGNQNNRRKI